jgi:hypothetical protein
MVAFSHFDTEMILFELIETELDILDVRPKLYQPGTGVVFDLHDDVVSINRLFIYKNAPAEVKEEAFRLAQTLNKELLVLPFKSVIDIVDNCTVKVSVVNELPHQAYNTSRMFQTK